MPWMSKSLIVCFSTISK